MKTVAAVLSCWLLVATAMNAQSNSVGPDDGIMVRISEIEILSQYSGEYKKILKEEAGDSVRLEAGVVAIFPMYEQANQTEIRILEIYADREAYEAHLKTPHFQKYKTTTLKMVKSLKLLDMKAIDAETMAAIFSKMRSQHEMVQRLTRQRQSLPNQAQSTPLLWTSPIHAALRKPPPTLSADTTSRRAR